MRLKTSCFNKALFVKNIVRLWPVWAFYLLILLYNMPVGLWSTMSSPFFGSAGIAVNTLTSQIYHKIFVVGTNMTAFFGILAAMGVFYYLYIGRSTCFFHALPIKRDGLFITNYLSGLCFLIVPNIVVFILTVTVEGIAGYLTMAPLLSWLGAVSAMSLFFYSFGVICAMFTGHIVALPVFYAILNVVAVGVEFLVKAVLSTFVFGITRSSSISRNISLGFLSPWYQLNVLTTVQDNKIVCWNLLIGYALAGAVFAVLGLLLYRNRRVESAGDIVAFKTVKPIFKYGAAFCLALLLSYLLYNVSGRANMNDSFWRVLIFMLLAGFVGYFASDMLLKKTFHVFKSGLRGWLIFSAALLLLSFSVKLDVFGYQNAIPNEQDVEQAFIDSYINLPTNGKIPNYFFGLRTQDGGKISEIVGLQKNIIADKAELERYISSAVPYESRDTQSEVPCMIYYIMKDGRTMLRSYVLPVTKELLQDPGSPAAGYYAIQNAPDNILARSFPENLTKINFNNGQINTGINGRIIYSGDSKPMAQALPYMPLMLSQDQSYQLYQALVKDIKDGHIGHTYPLTDETYGRNVYTYSVTLHFSGKFPDWRIQNDQNNYGDTTSFQLEAASANTLAALEDMGFLDRSQLITQGDERQAGQLLKSSFKNIPVNYAAYYIKYMEALKKGTKDAIQYTHFENGDKSAYTDSKDKLLDYGIRNIERVNDKLYAFTISATSSASRDGKPVTAYNFVGIIDGKLRVLCNTAQIPPALRDNLDPLKYKNTDPSVLWPG